MNLDDARLVPVAGGGGLACRFPGVALFCGGHEPADAVADLIGRCRRAAQAAEPGPGLIRQLAGLVTATDQAAMPPFAVIARTAEGLAVLVNGGLDVDIAADDGGETLSGSSSITCVDRLVTRPVTRISVHRPGVQPPPGVPEVDVVEGVTPADALVIETRSGGATAPPEPAPVARVAPDPTAEAPAAPAAASPPPPPVASPAAPPQASPPAAPPPADPGPAPDVAPPPPPPPPPPPAAPAPAPAAAATPAPAPAPSEPAEVRGFDAVLLQDPGADEPAAAEPLPVEPDPGEARQADAESDQVMVRGTVCSRGHFNDPRSRFCSSCGISMVHQTLNLISGTRPPLGVLVFEDGTTFSLSANYVVGRQPHTSPLIESGEARPLVLEDTGQTISRIHAELRLEGWDVYFVHRSGTNGSFLLDKAVGQWSPLPNGEPVQLGSGARVAMGGRVAVFESALVR